MTAETAVPSQGTRPRNRRALIVAAATVLFHQRGYDQVAMGDIAEAVGIGPSALYRHFSGKQDLLREVVTSAADGMRAIFESVDLGDSADRPASLRRLAEVTLDHREYGLLAQREARHLAIADQQAERASLREIGRRLRDQVAASRPDLGPAGCEVLAWSVIAVLGSTSFHRLALPRPDHLALVAELIEVVLTTDLGAFGSAPPAEEPGSFVLSPGSRREALQDQAVRMFARHGYSEVGIEEIGAAVGIAGPSIYNHFANKHDLLITALRRGTAVLFMDLVAIRRTAASADDAVAAYVASYVRFALDHDDILDLLITEIRHLPADERAALRQTQRDYVGEWVHLLRLVRPDLEPLAARIRVHAAMTVVSDLARIGHLRAHPDLAPALEALSGRVLRLDS